MSSNEKYFKIKNGLQFDDGTYVTTAVGFVGATGAQGNVGATGSAGPTGATGSQGQTGATGSQGSQGNVGATGAQGIQGATGTQGPQGATGLVGATGLTGATGSTGATGPQGVSSNIFHYKANTTNHSTSTYTNNGFIDWDNATQISSGNLMFSHLTTDGIDIDIFLALLETSQKIIIQDENQSNNYQSWQITSTPVHNVSGADSWWVVPVTLLGSGGTGTTGFSNNSQVILALASGSQGATGATGHQGATGVSVTGATGATGQTGNQGATGVKGDTGNQGATGVMGPSGNDGYMGATGAAGQQGATGSQGPAGATGSQGSQGNQGATGVATTGATGSQGATGVQGNVGATGATGVQGTQGLQGATGVTGGVGATGSAGSAGNTGATGASGLGYAALTSTTTRSTGSTGSQTWTVNLDASQSAFIAGQRVRITPTAGSGYIEGNINSYSGTSLTVNISYLASTGLNYSAWTFSIAGDLGSTGPTGATGATGTGNPGATGATGSAGGVGATGAAGSFATAETLYSGWGSVSAGTYKIDVSSGTVHKMTLAGNFVFDGFTTPTTGTSVTVLMRQDATGSRLLSTSTNANTVWAGGVKTLSTVGNSSDVLTLFYQGATGGSVGAYIATLSRGYTS